MPTHATFDTFLASNTFGRNQVPLMQHSTIQQGQVLQAGQMGSDTYQARQVQDDGLPHDFDHLVRSVGEW